MTPQVPKVLVHFIEMLGQHNYLALPQGNTIISYIIKIVESDPSVRRSTPEGMEGRVGSKRERGGYAWHM